MLYISDPNWKKKMKYIILGKAYHINSLLASPLECRCTYLPNLWSTLCSIFLIKMRGTEKEFINFCKYQNDEQTLWEKGVGDKRRRQPRNEAHTTLTNLPTTHAQKQINKESICGVLVKYCHTCSPDSDEVDCTNRPVWKWQHKNETLNHRWKYCKGEGASIENMERRQYMRTRLL